MAHWQLGDKDARQWFVKGAQWMDAHNDRDPEVVSKDDVQMLEDLVLAACNEALRKSRELVQQELGKLTGGLKIPGLGM